MALLSDDMRTLAQNLLQDHDIRLEAVAGLRTNVRQELKNYRSTHQAMTAEQEKVLDQHMEALRQEVAEASLATSKFLNDMDAQQQALSAEQRQKLGEHMLSLRGQVADASQATVDFLKKIDQEHQAMTGEQRHHLAEQMDGLRQQVSDLRQAAATFLRDLNKSNQSMADELSLQLIGQRSRLTTDTAAFINTISSARQEMATQQTQGRINHSKKLHQNVRDLRQNAATFLIVTDAAHQSMATAQKHRMVKGRNQLMAEVTTTREKLQLLQSAVRTDQAEAAKVWANLSQLKQKNRAKNVPDAFFQPAESAGTKRSPAAPVNHEDDLKAIHGIGAVMEKLLREAGITSYRHLAASTPEELHSILGKNGKLAKVETWITQAKNLIQ